MSSKSLIFRVCWLTLKTRISLVSLEASHILLQSAAPRRISAQICNNTVVSHGILPTRTLKKNWARKEKSCLWMANHQKCTFSHQITLKPSKTGSTHDFIFRKQYGDKTKSSKNHEFFNFQTSGCTVKISCFQKKIRGKRVVVH